MDEGDESKRNSFGPMPAALASANPTPFHKSARLRPPTSKTKSKQHQKFEGLASGGGVSSLPTPSLGISRQHSALAPRSASLVPPAGGATTTSNASGASSLSCSNYSLRSLLRISDYAVQQRLHVNTIDRARTTDDAPSTAAATAKSSRRGSFSSIAVDAPPERKSSFDSLVERRRSLFRGLHDPAQRRSISADDEESATPSTAAAQSPAHEIPACEIRVSDQVTHNSQSDAPVARVSTGSAGDAVAPSTVRPMARSKGRSSEPRLPTWKFRPIGCDHSISIDEENSTDAALNDAGSPSLFASSQQLQLRRDTIETQATACDAVTPLLGKCGGSSPRHSPKGERAHPDAADAKSANGQRSRQNSKSGGGLLARVAALFCIGRCARPFHRHSSRSRNSPSGQPLSPRDRGDTSASTRLD